MLTIKKDAIKYKNADGQMESAGVLCKVGTFGVDWFKYATTLQAVFQNAVFDPDSEITLNIPNIKSSIFNSFQMSVNAKKITLIGGELAESLNCQNAFYGCKQLEVVDLTNFYGKIGNGSQLFYSCSVLKEIFGELDFSKATNVNYMFNMTTGLEEVRFKSNTLSLSISFQHSYSLSDTSIQSIIDGLADLTGQTAQTITFHADVKAKLTEEQIATITSKNWTLA